MQHLFMEHLFDLFEQTSGVSIDTRKIEKDCLFICLKGENFDGNTFAEEALIKGAKYVISDNPVHANKENIYVVEDSLSFLQQLARHHRRKMRAKVIGITGSNGKTSSKELINCVLSQGFAVLATQGNLNNHIGVPLTLLRLKQHHEIAIIEMGANKFKDIEELCAIAEPNYGIITNIGKAHLEGFLNFEGVLKTKTELYQAVSSVGGTIVYNEDDATLKNQLPKNVSLYSYGASDSAAIQGNLIGLNPYVQFSWTSGDYSSQTVSTHMIGTYNFYNFLAAISFGKLFGLTEEMINSAISSYIPENNRSQVMKTAKNTLILDCYNANPTSMKSALESFALIEAPNKFFIIGDMLELGKESLHEHQMILDLASELNLKGITVGPIFNSLDSHILTNQFILTTDAIEYFNQETQHDAMILLKGSRGIGLEKLANVL
jgi:UDP-N-acetylmuramoyl-tripeptide--D-alanyl-D-alanine ligase